MTSRLARDCQTMLVWSRGVRTRLVATYLVAAIALAGAGVFLFTSTLGRGLVNNVDSGLQARADTVAADLGPSGAVQGNSTPPGIRASSRLVADNQAITAVYAPSGKLVIARPGVLPASPLTATRSTSAPVGDLYRTEQYGGASFRMLIRSFTRDDGVWQIVVGQSLNAVDEAQGEVRHVLIIAVPILLALLAIGAWLLSGAALRPVDRMRADAERLGEHDADGRISEPASRDSLNQLARTFNALLDRLHSSLDKQRGLIADAGHELRTPLAVLQTELETAVRPNRTREDLVDSINHARIEVDRLATVAEDLLLLAQADGGQQLVRPQLCDVSGILDEVGARYQDRAKLHAVTLTIHGGRELTADLDPAALHRILDNLITNALRHTPADGTITIDAHIEHLSDPAQSNGVTPVVKRSSAALRLRVRDTGPGFPEDFLPQAFDRFSRADQARSRSKAAAGSGLGLAIVLTLVLAHAGTVTVENMPRGGASVEVSIPAIADLPDEAGR